MKITILAYLEPDATEPDVVMPQVAEALEAAGHKTQVLTIHSDVPAMIAAIQQARPDLIYNLVEGFADDIMGGLMGVVGVLDLLQIPYTGGGPGELYLQEDKALAKRLLSYEQVLYPDYAVFAPGADFETGGGKLRMPLFVKPLRMEASLGIDEASLVRTTKEMMDRVQYIHTKIGDAALVEEYIEGREFYVGVLGNQDPIAFPPIEMDFSGLPDSPDCPTAACPCSTAKPSGTPRASATRAPRRSSLSSMRSSMPGCRTPPSTPTGPSACGTMVASTCGSAPTARFT
jgi:D-alanine-D-alanine ligase